MSLASPLALGEHPLVAEVRVFADKPILVLGEDGSLGEAPGRPQAPDAVQIALFDEPVFLMTGIEWSGLALSGRIEAMIAIDCVASLATEEEVLRVLPEHSLLWLSGWQRQVNDGSCWTSSGSIGRCASDLIDSGFLLLSPRSVRTWLGDELPSREQVRPGRPGSPRFVEHIMGRPYLDWVSAVP